MATCSPIDTSYANSSSSNADVSIANTLVVPAATTVSPYYDDFTESKNFHRILFRPGYAVQARELTQIQTILQNQIERFGRNIFVNGSSVLGGKLSITNTINLNVNPSYANSIVDITQFKNQTIILSSGNTDVMARVVQTIPSTNNTPAAIAIKYLTGKEFDPGATIMTYPGNVRANLVSTSNVSSNGTIAFINDSVYFMDGFFIKVPSQSIVLSSFDSKANALVGLQYVDSVVTETSDTSLLDPALEASNYQAPGAARYQVFLNLTTRNLGSFDKEKFIQIARVERGVIKDLVTTPLYSQIEDEMARRTYDEAGNYIVNPFMLSITNSTVDPGNNYTLNFSAGKAYLYGYKVSNRTETQIEIPAARTTFPISNYNLNINYGNYLIVNQLKGAFDTAGMGIVDIHCVVANAVNYANTTTYNSTKIGTARIRDINFYGTPDTNTINRMYEFYFFNNQFNTVVANATALSTNTLQIIANSPSLSSISEAYQGATLTVLNGPSTGTQATITDYTNKTISLDTNLYQNTNTSTQFSISFNMSAVNSFVSNTKYANATYNASASVSPIDKNTSSAYYTTIVNEPSLRKAFFSYPQSYVAPGITPVGYTYRRVYNSINFTGGSSVVITASDGENFAGSTATESYDLNVMENFMVIVTNAGTSSRNVGDQVAVTSVVTTSTPEQVTLYTGANSESFTATVYAVVNATNDAVHPRVKTLHIANTTVFSSSAPTATFNNSTGSNTFVYLNDSQVVIQNFSPTQPESLFVSDVAQVIAVYQSPTAPTAGMSLSGLNNITTHFILDRGQQLEYYDHASLQLKPGFANPTGYLIICLRYYSSGSDVGYFSIDSYPYLTNTVYEKGSSIGTGYTIIPKVSGIKLADTIDFRPVRPNASNNSNWSFTSARTPLAVTNFLSSYSYYLPRYDLVYMTLNNPLTLAMGTPNQTPNFPNQPHRSMLLYKLRVLPYTTDINSIIVETIDHRRYTMEDVSKIDQRLKNIEYSVSLNALQASATSLSIKDANGLERTKYGIFAEDFTSFLLSDTTSSDFNCALDIAGTFVPGGGALLPVNNKNYLNITANSAETEHVSVGDNWATLAYITVPAISQNVASKSVSIAPYLFAEFTGQIITVPESEQFYDITTVAPTIITIPNPPPPPRPPSPTPYPTPNPSPGPYPSPPPQVTVNKLVLNYCTPINQGLNTLTWCSANQNWLCKATGILGQSPGQVQVKKNACGQATATGMNCSQLYNLVNQGIKTSGYPCASTKGVASSAMICNVYNIYVNGLNRPPDLAGIEYWSMMATINNWCNVKLHNAMGCAAWSDGELSVSGHAGGVNLVPTNTLNNNGVLQSIVPGTITTIQGPNINTNGVNGYSVVGTPGRCSTTTTATPGTSLITTSTCSITDFYGTILGRTPDPGGLAYWQNQLNSASCKTAELASIKDAFLASPENQQNIANKRINTSCNATGAYDNPAWPNGGSSPTGGIA